MLDALLDLLSDGVLRPTAQQVADRSGVSLRSIFRIFADVESLNAAAASRQFERVRHLFVDVPASGPLEERITKVIAINSRLYESVAPVRRAAARFAGESPALQEQLARARSRVRGEVERVFATELRGDPALAAAIELALSFEGWDQLRMGQGATVELATDAVTQILRTLLSPEPG